MDVNIQDEGQTGIKEVTGPIPAEEKTYAVRNKKKIIIIIPIPQGMGHKKFIALRVSVYIIWYCSL